MTDIKLNDKPKWSISDILDLGIKDLYNYSGFQKTFNKAIPMLDKLVRNCFNNLRDKIGITWYIGPGNTYRLKIYSVIEKDLYMYDNIEVPNLKIIDRAIEARIKCKSVMVSCIIYKYDYIRLYNLRQYFGYKSGKIYNNYIPLNSEILILSDEELLGYLHTFMLTVECLNERKRLSKMSFEPFKEGTSFIECN